MKKNTALVIGQLGLVHSLQEAGIPFILGTEKDNNYIRYSKFVKNVSYFSSFKSEKFVEELCELAKSLSGKAVIFSDDDDAIYTISEHRERLEGHYLFSFPNKETVSKVLDKQHFSILAEKYDLPAPKSFNISNINELTNAAENCEFPCIIKPVFRSDWYHPDFSKVVGKYKKAFVLENKEDLLQLYNKITAINPNLVLQEYIEGDDKLHFSVNMYVDENHITRGIYIC
ncbi:MAG: hypothetical protein U5K71_16470 [Gracilimonas sp.]|nr:hypothetical protein [Gracilimonas sp.]